MSYDKDNIFAKILRKDIPCDPVFENDYVLAFKDISPAAPVHILVIPKGEYSSFHDFSQHAPSDMLQAYFAAVSDIAEQQGLTESGYRLISNHGANASQTVPHFHMHILGGKRLGGLLEDDTLER